MTRTAVSLLAAGAVTAVAAGMALGARPIDDGVSRASPPSGLHGTVYRGPITPVCRADLPCEVPAPGVALVFARPGAKSVRVQTSEDGTYRALLRAGIYSVTTDVRTLMKAPAPRLVKVRLTHVDELDFHIDTGIR